MDKKKRNQGLLAILAGFIFTPLGAVEGVLGLAFGWFAIILVCIGFYTIFVARKPETKKAVHAINAILLGVIVGSVFAVIFSFILY
jgi:hypothetical protein